MKCPLREDMLGRMPECESDCAWRVGDECAAAIKYNDTFAPNKVVSCDADTSNDNDLDLDSREKLEDAAEAIALLYTESVIHADALLGKITKLLDRQAAITKRECKERVDFSLITQTANALFPDYQERVSELQKKVDELTAENNEYESICDSGKTLFDDVRAERNDYRRRLADIREIATFPLCIDYDHEEVDA